MLASSWQTVSEALRILPHRLYLVAGEKVEERPTNRTGSALGAIMTNPEGIPNTSWRSIFSILSINFGLALWRTPSPEKVVLSYLLTPL
jgi:hypothetical protein